MLDKASIMREPPDLADQRPSPTGPDTRRENERNRIEETGSGAELFRRAQLANLRAHFWASASTAAARTFRAVYSL